MRLWHYDLLDVLPDKWLIAQWRECSAIKRKWELGTLDHKLVNYVMDYDKKYFMWYTRKVVMEMDNKGINYSKKLYQDIKDFCESDFKPYLLEYNYSEHNNRYLKQCYYNLQEKYDRGIISEEDWKEIQDKIGDKIK